MKLYSINTGHFKLDGGAMFGVVPKSMWQKLNPPDENNMCSWAMRCLLIENGNRLILVDNGMGNKQDEKFFGHYFLHGDDTLEKSLAKNGFSTDDITDVFSFTENIKVRLMNGHTEAMMLPQINYKEKTIVFMADLLPSVAHIPIPYVMAYDTKPLQTLQEKKLFLTEAQQKDYILFFEHDPEIECCTLQLTEKGIRRRNTFDLSDI